MKGVYWLCGSDVSVADIESSLFTHIFCAFANLDKTTNKVTIPSQFSAQFSTFTETVRRKNPDVKTLLSIGGGNATADDFASMASQPNSRQSFIHSSISLARSYNFHGLDLDWEYPKTESQMAAFSTLLTEWRAAVERESRSSRMPQLLLSAAVFRSSDYYRVPIPTSSLALNLDWINVMTYDFYGPLWSADSTGAPAALYRSPMQWQVNCDEAIMSWIHSGFPASKIVLGIPFYGWAWQLQNPNPNNNGLYAPANGPAAIPETGNDGSITYKQIKRSFIETNRVNPMYDSEIVSNYVHSGTTWIGYDDTQSVAAKVSYAKRMELFGYFAWQVAADDDTWTLSRTGTYSR